jgi:DNA oxidative demethylase
MGYRKRLCGTGVRREARIFVSASDDTSKIVMAQKSSSREELPAGFLYKADFITSAEEQELLAHFRELEFRPFNFQGYVAKRRIVDYGFEYDFTSRKASETKAIPDFLKAFQRRAAELAQVEADEIGEAIITEYPAGAPIGWHRDVPQFETIIGISLASSCRMRLKPYKGEGKIVSIELEPRSSYVISSEARWNYQHSIPAVKELRYSITFRTLRDKAKLTKRSA